MAKEEISNEERLAKMRRCDGSSLTLTQWAEEWGKQSDRLTKAYSAIQDVAREIDEMRQFADRMCATCLGAANSWVLAKSLLGQDDDEKEAPPSG